ncbi:MAG: hypothetical protein WD403_03255 [Pirellulales bacterium]
MPVYGETPAVTASQLGEQVVVVLVAAGGKVEVDRFAGGGCVDVVEKRDHAQQAGQVVTQRQRVEVGQGREGVGERRCFATGAGGAGGQVDRRGVDRVDAMVDRVIETPAWAAGRGRRPGALQ